MYDTINLVIYMKTLLHTCCAPCSIECIPYFEKDELTLFWFNPNIPPALEYKNRLNALREYTKQINVSLVEKENYELLSFIKNTIDDVNNRCDYCYKVRLEATAKYAHDNGFEAFSTTLLISPYQNHDKLKDLGNEYATKYNIKFHYFDPRENFKRGQIKAKEQGVYIQKYCGCIYSESLRYNKKI